MLFDSFTRTDATPARADESRFAFLNRSASQYFADVRELLEEWLGHVPEEARRDLIGALRRDNRQHEAAFWELYLHEAYRRSGCGIEIHPRVQGVSTRPDFRITAESGSFFLEAVSVGQDKLTIAETRRMAAVERVLDEMPVEDFVLGVETYAIGPAPLATGPLRGALRRWLASLDPDEVVDTANASSAVGFDRLPEMSWQQAGWSLVFQALPLIEEARGRPRRALGMRGPGEAQIVDNVSGLRRVLDRKYGRYGVLDAPLVIAVQSNTEIPTRDYEVEHVLYGVASRRPSDPQLQSADLLKEGFWRTRSGWRRGDCPQIMSVYGLAPWVVPRTAPRLWSTLEADVEAPRQPSWLSPVTIGDEPIVEPGADLAEHFGLDAKAWCREPDFDLTA